MGIKISELQSFVGSVQDTDLLEISVDNGLGGFNSRKITGAQLKALINSLNFYESDGTFTGNRTASGGGTYGLIIDNTSGIQFNDTGTIIATVNPPSFLATDRAINFEVDPTNLTGAIKRLFQIKDSAGSVLRFAVIDDGRLLVNEAYYLPNADGNADEVLTTDGAGNVSFQAVVSGDAVNFGSTQWGRTISTPVDLLDGQIANGLTFFTDSDKVTGGTTTYNEYNIAYGISITLSGTNGNALVNVNGTDYQATFNSTLFQTALDFVSTHETALNADNVRIFALGSGADGRLRFCSSESILNGITITNTTGDLSGTIANEFTGTSTASPDHILVPYSGTAYDGQRLQHNFRVNFGIVTGSSQFYALSLRRYEDDSIIGSEIQIQRNNDVEGVQQNFISYTAGSTDPFVLGGFYFALRNDTGQTAQITSAIGILVQTYYQKPTKF